MAPDQLPPLRGRSTITTVVLVVIFIALCLVLWMYRNTPPLSRFFGADTAVIVPSGSGNTVVSYTCDEGKTVQAEYIDGGAASSTPDGRPVPTGAVELTFADGTMMRIPQTLSASGTRYANQDESFIFWSKGTTAFIQQGTGSDQKETYSNCTTHDAQ